MGTRNKHTFQKGHIVSEETRKKLSESQKGKKRGDEICIHHIDGNHFNDIPSNRMIVSRSDHAFIHFSQEDSGLKRYWMEKKNERSKMAI